MKLLVACWISALCLTSVHAGKLRHGRNQTYADGLKDASLGPESEGKVIVASHGSHDHSYLRNGVLTHAHTESDIPDPRCPDNSLVFPCGHPFACLPNPMPSNAVIVWGDSHAVVMKPAIEAAVGSAGQIFWLISWSWEQEHGHAELMKARLTEHLGKGHSVMFIERGDLNDDAPHTMSIDAFSDRLNFMKALTLERGAKLFVFKDNQLLPQQPAMCKLTNNPCQQSKTAELARQSQKRAVIDSSVAGANHIFVFDVLDHTCTSTACSMYEPNGDHLIFQDDDHLNSCGSELLKGPLTNFLRPHLSAVV